MKKNKVLITGINGFVGSHLAKEMSDYNLGVIGVGFDEKLNPRNSLYVQSYVKADLVDGWPETEEVDSIIHLAGLAAVGPSFDHPQQYINQNSAMVTNMCENYLKTNNSPRIIIVSSGSIYDPNDQMPLNESSKICFNSPYAISKVLNENQASYYSSRGLDIVVARPFNHIGPNQSSGFLIPDLVNGVREAIEDNKKLTVGNLETKRDYTDVRDVARAYRLLATTKRLGSFAYNICSGISVSGKEVLRKITNEMNVVDLELEVDQSRVRPSDPKNITGDCSLLTTQTGWQPKYTIDQSIKDFIEVNLKNEPINPYSPRS